MKHADAFALNEDSLNDAELRGVELSDAVLSDAVLSDAAQIECERLINTGRRFVAARKTAQAHEAYGLVECLLKHGALSSYQRTRSAALIQASLGE